MLIKVLKRPEPSKAYSIGIRLAAILFALLSSGLFILFLGHNPVEVYRSMVEGSLGNAHRIEQTILKCIPLIITSLGIAVAFKMKFWNIGAEGQIMMGAFAATFVALRYPEMPKPLLLILMGLAAVVVGGIWGVIPAIFKAKFGTNETILTLMFNYIAIKWVSYLQYGPWKDPKSMGFPKIAMFSDNAILPEVFGIHIGWIIALILVIIMHIFIHYTKQGYEISVTGESEGTARYAGMNVPMIIVFTMLLSGGICGLSGMIEASAVSNTLSVNVSGGVGYTAIITTWLASLSAPIISVASFLFAMMIQGGSFIQIKFEIPAAAAQMLQGMILFFILGSEFFIRYRLSFRGIKKQNEEVEG